MLDSPQRLSLFFFNDTATTEIYTLSLHDALPILRRTRETKPDIVLLDLSMPGSSGAQTIEALVRIEPTTRFDGLRSEEHTSELQSRLHLVCRLLLEKKKT